MATENLAKEESKEQVAESMAAKQKKRTDNINIATRNEIQGQKRKSGSGKSFSRRKRLVCPTCCSSASVPQLRLWQGHEIVLPMMLVTSVDYEQMSSSIGKHRGSRCSSGHSMRRVPQVQLRREAVDGGMGEWAKWHDVEAEPVVRLEKVKRRQLEPDGSELLTCGFISKVGAEPKTLNAARTANKATIPRALHGCTYMMSSSARGQTP